MDGLSKKQMKKWKGILSKLLTDGLQAGTEPSKTLAVGNGGIHNGVCPSKLFEVLKAYGEIEKFTVIPKKSYVIITFTSVNSATSIFKNAQGTDIEKSDGGPNATLYFYYLNTNINSASQLQAIHSKPQGLHIHENFITEEEERLLIDKIEGDLMKQSKLCVQAVLKHRQVLHYGYKFQYGTNDVDVNDPLAKKDMPEHVSKVIEKVMETELWEGEPDQCTVNKYEPGHGIPFHVDNPDAFTTSISSLSLGSSILFEMKHPVGNVFNILLKPRSLLTLTGEARYEWTHGIKPKKTDIVHDSNTNSEVIIHRGVRWSLTLRKVKDKTGEKENGSGLPTDMQDALEIEKRHVHGVYNKIATHFASTREKPWPKVVEFLHSLSPHSLVLDIGCGSGRYLCTENTGHFIFGCDRSSSLIEICQGKHPFVFVSDGLNIPMRKGYFDACICIAVIHHYFTAERRLSAIKEIVSLLRKGGKALIQVWAAEQVYKNKHSAYLNKQSVNNCTADSLIENLETLKVECPGDQKPNVCSLPIHKNRNHFAQQDMFVPWKLKNSPMQAPTNTHYRFYHVFKEGELDQLCNSVDGCTLERSYYDNGNWAAIITKNI